MITYTPLYLLMGILQRLVVDMPMPYNPIFDLDGSGLITVADLLLCLALFG